MKPTIRQGLMVGVVTFIFTLPFVFASCRQEVKPSVDFVYDPEIIPSMRTVNDTMLISDSGLIRYKMIAKTWDVFEQSKDPNWFFPDGLYIEQFDTAFQVVVTIKADTAWNYTKRKLWRLKGHVFVRNTLGETFSSEELFWNQQLQKIYSDKYVEIDRPEKGILRGRGGFEANQQMTEYEFKEVGESTAGKTILYMKEDKENNEEKAE